MAWIVSGTWAPTATTSIPIVAVGTERSSPHRVTTAESKAESTASQMKAESSVNG